MANNDARGYPKSVEMERGANSAPLKQSISKAPKAATYRQPKAHPDNPHTNKDTGSFRGDRPRSQRAIPVQPSKT